MRDEKQLTAMIVPFYLGQADAKGRMIQEIWAWDFKQIEGIHDYIQWLFPLPERSSFNPDAPVVDDEVIQAFHTSTDLRHNLLKSLTLMLRFYCKAARTTSVILLYSSQRSIRLASRSGYAL